MNVVRREERLLDRAIDIEEVVRQIEYVHLRVTVEFQWIERCVGLLDVFIENDARRVARQNLCDDDVRHRELFAEIGHTHLHTLGRRFDARLRGKKHVVVADHQDDQLRFKPRNAAVIETPQNVLQLVTADTDVDRLVLRKVLLPGIVEHALVERAAPLLCDTVAHEQNIDRPFIGLHVINELRMCIKP